MNKKNILALALVAFTVVGTASLRAETTAAATEKPSKVKRIKKALHLQTGEQHTSAPAAAKPVAPAATTPSNGSSTK